MIRGVLFVESLLGIDNRVYNVSIIDMGIILEIYVGVSEYKCDVIGEGAVSNYLMCLVLPEYT